MPSGSHPRKRENNRKPSDKISDGFSYSFELSFFQIANSLNQTPCINKPKLRYYRESQPSVHYSDIHVIRIFLSRGRQRNY